MRKYMRNRPELSIGVAHYFAQLMVLARRKCSRYVLGLKGGREMGTSRYDKPIIPFTSNVEPYDLDDPVEALIAQAMAKFQKVDYFPEPTAENFVHFISLRNVVPELCRTLRYTNKRLKELCPDDHGIAPTVSGSPDAKPQS
jgi:hypothetical protein